MSILLLYAVLHITLGFALGCFNYFRNKAKDIAAVAELVAILLVWPLLGVIYIVVEVARILDTGGDPDA